MSWDDIAKSYANLGWRQGGGGEESGDSGDLAEEYPYCSAYFRKKKKASG